MKTILVVNNLAVFNGTSSFPLISFHMKLNNHKLACTLLYEPPRRGRYDVWMQGLSWKWYQAWNITTLI